MRECTRLGASLANTLIARRPAAMTQHTSVKAAALAHTSRNPPKVWKIKAPAFKRTPAETRKEQLDQGKSCICEDGPFLFSSPGTYTRAGI